MDRLTAFVTKYQAALRIEIATFRNEQYGATDMATPFLQGLTKALDMMEHDLEAGAKDLTAKIASVGTRGKAAFVKGQQRIDGVASHVSEVEKFVVALEGSNGGDPLDDSSDTSVKSPPATSAPLPETVTVTAADVGAIDQSLTIGLATDKPENLTVNGVSKEP
jgi:hypothetical protein